MRAENFPKLRLLNSAVEMGFSAQKSNTDRVQAMEIGLFRAMVAGLPRFCLANGRLLLRIR
jgi:hypothetical protein